MKPPFQPDDDHDFNPPRVMLVRMVNGLSLAAFSAGLLLILGGSIWRDVHLLAGGIAALAVAGLLREWLLRRGRLAAADTASDTPAPQSSGSDLERARVARLVELLRVWERLERRRGSPEFDPWALHEVRQDIRAMIERDPALERLFHV